MKTVPTASPAAAVALGTGAAPRRGRTPLLRRVGWARRGQRVRAAVDPREPWLDRLACGGAQTGQTPWWWLATSTVPVVAAVLAAGAVAGGAGPPRHGVRVVRVVDRAGGPPRATRQVPAGGLGAGGRLPPPASACLPRGAARRAGGGR